MNAWGKRIPLALVWVHTSVVSVASATEMIDVSPGYLELGETGFAEPVHNVTLTHSFLMDRYEVTNAEYANALQWALGQGLINVSEATGIVTDVASGKELIYLNQGAGDNQCWIDHVSGNFTVAAGHEQWPATFMSWHGAAAYCDWRSGMEARTPAYMHAVSDHWPCGPNGDPYLAAGYRLPTEAEWEYSAQYDDERAYPWGTTDPDPARLNYAMIVGHPEPVGSHPSGNSALGFSDLAGNVAEWVNDWYGTYGSDEEIDPAGPGDGVYRIQRGGAFWQYDMWKFRCSDRSNYGTPQWSEGLGFRAVRTSAVVPVLPRSWGRIKALYR